MEKGSDNERDHRRYLLIEDVSRFFSESLAKTEKFDFGKILEEVRDGEFNGAYKYLQDYIDRENLDLENLELGTESARKSEVLDKEVSVSLGKLAEDQRRKINDANGLLNRMATFTN